ncbi:MAG: D-2-hydroxyacid dehydrogenase [Acidimicrobiales bacterium]|jgi:phosphoglycerate dehydrogenase-like enzyme
MTARSLLLTRPAYDMMGRTIESLSHELDVLIWTADAISRPDGTPVDPADARPEAAWVSVDLLFSGEFPDFVDAALALGTVQWFQGCLAGTDAPPFAKIKAAGVRLSNSDAPNAGVAEYVMSSVLHVVHGIGARVAAHRAREWVQVPWREINGMTWAVVGFGSIGGEIAQRAKGFGVEIVGIRRTSVEDDRADRMATMDNLHEELARADVVVLACPLTEATAGMADAAFFAAMKEDSILVNVSRGPVVDTPALLKALDGGAPAMAILDVFDVEPLPEDSPIWDHPNVFLTSHIAGAGAGFVERGAKLFIEQLDGYLAGRPLRLEVS